MEQKSNVTFDVCEIMKNIEIAMAFNSLKKLFYKCVDCIRISEEDGNQLVQNFEEQLKHLTNTLDAPMLGINSIFL